MQKTLSLKRLYCIIKTLHMAALLISGFALLPYSKKVTCATAIDVLHVCSFPVLFDYAWVFSRYCFFLSKSKTMQIGDADNCYFKQTVGMSECLLVSKWPCKGLVNYPRCALPWPQNFWDPFQLSHNLENDWAEVITCCLQSLYIKLKRWKAKIAVKEK